MYFKLYKVQKRSTYKLKYFQAAQHYCLPIALGIFITARAQAYIIHASITTQCESVNHPRKHA